MKPQTEAVSPGTAWLSFPRTMGYTIDRSRAPGQTRLSRNSRLFGTGSILTAILAFAVVTSSPGPSNIATATVAMRFGRRNSLVFGAGLAFGLACWGVLAAAGMGAILQGSVYLLIALKIFGGLYLLWLAIQSGRALLQPADSAKHGAPKDGRWFLRGLGLNLSNPKAVLAWLAALSMGMGPPGSATGHVVLTTAVCIAFGFLNYALYALAFSLPGCMAGYRRFRKWIEGVTAGFFALAGFGLIRSAFAR